MTEWKIQKSSYFEARFKRFQKNHPGEAQAMLNNLDTYLTALNEGINPVNLTAGFIFIRMYQQKQYMSYLSGIKQIKKVILKNAGIT